jgi:hypothetical protein
VSCDSSKPSEGNSCCRIDRKRLQTFMRSFSSNAPDVHVSIASVPQQKGEIKLWSEFIRAFVNGEQKVQLQWLMVVRLTRGEQRNEGRCM